MSDSREQALPPCPYCGEVGAIIGRHSCVRQPSCSDCNDTGKLRREDAGIHAADYVRCPSCSQPSFQPCRLCGSNQEHGMVQGMCQNQLDALRAENERLRAVLESVDTEAERGRHDTGGIARASLATIYCTTQEALR